MPVYIIFLFAIGGGSIFFLTVFFIYSCISKSFARRKNLAQNGLMVLLLGMHMHNR